MESKRPDEIKRLRKEIRRMRREIKEMRTELKTLVDVVSKSHAKMDQHVDFVENIYSSVRHPLNYVKNRIEQFMGKQQSPCLPQIEDKNETDNGSDIKAIHGATHIQVLLR
jgi:phage shock protein A